MKTLHSFFVAIMAAALLAGCSHSSKPDPNAPKTPADDITTLKQAVQTFNSKEGHFPKTLDELAPTYIAKIPDAPGGFKLIYNPDTGEVKVSR
jgi:ABC-type glycerol-3-phosphate transport system substrate-binding protein